MERPSQEGTFLTGNLATGGKCRPIVFKVRVTLQCMALETGLMANQ